MSQRRNYLNFTTPWGVSLSLANRMGWSGFLLHESGYQAALDDWNHERVDSPFWRLYHNPKPGCSLRFQGQELPLLPDAVWLIPADTVFDCCGPVLACHFWLHFTVAKRSGEVPCVPVRFALTEVLQSLLTRAITTHLEPESEQRNHQIYHHSAALLHEVFALWDVPQEKTLPDWLTEVLNLIQRAPHADLSNPYLAQRARLSLESFIRQFKVFTGQTPAAYVLKTRLRLAAEALATSDKTVDQIAAETGFPNRHYFTRRFSQKNGCGPAEYRQRQHRRKGR